MISGDQRYRVYNRCNYDIGVRLLNGVELNIKAGGFQLLTVNDILFVESSSPKKKFFSKKLLVPVGDDNKDVSIDSFGLVEDEVSHLTEDEINTVLKQSVKKIESWIDNIDDASELDAIYKVAVEMELPLSKIKVLKQKMPEKDWLDELGE